MKVGVIGVGALGSLFGGCLQLAKVDVSFIFKTLEKKILFDKKGLFINFQHQRYHIFPKTFLASELKNQFDIILIFTKTIDTMIALHSIKKIIGLDTILMSLQNGLDNDLILQNFVKPKNIIYGTTMVAADQRAINKVFSFGNNLTYFKPKHHFSHKISQQISEALNYIGITAKINQNIDKLIWEKVAFNSAMNSICALLNCTPKSFNNKKYLKDFLLSVVKESCNIGIANKIKVNVNQITNKIEVSCSEHGHHKPSMLKDVLEKKLTEIDSINGALVKYGIKSKVSTVLNEALVKLIKAKEKNY